jgi:hypothetical protein
MATRTAISAMALLLLALAPAVTGATIIQDAGVWGGRCEAVEMRGQTAFFSAGSQIIAADLSDPANPTVIGQSPSHGDVITDIALFGDYLYAGFNTAGIQVLSIANPQEMTWIEGVAGSGSCRSIATDGSLLVVSTIHDVFVYTLTSPAGLQLAGSFSTTAVCRGLKIVGHYVYVCAGTNLLIIDVADPAHPSQVASRSLSAPNDLAIAGNFAYIADAARMRIFDITNPIALVARGSVATGSDTNSIAVAGTTAYVGTNSSGFLVVNVSNAAAPTIAATESYPQNIFAVGAGPGRVAAACDNVLYAYDTSTPAQPVRIGGYGTGSSIKVEVIGQMLYALERWGGFQIHDVSNPLNPSGIAFADPFWPNVEDFKIQGEYVYVITSNHGLAIYSIQNPARPRIISSLQLPQFTGSIDVSGDVAFVGGLLVYVIDISDRLAPVQTGFLPIGYTLDIALGSDILFTLSTDGMLRATDVSDPAQPVILGDGFYVLAPQPFVLSGNRIFADSAALGVLIIDASEPANLYQLGSEPQALDVNVPFVHGDILMAGIGFPSRATLIDDISTPATPRRLAEWPIVADTAGFLGSYVFLGTEYNGTRVLQIVRSGDTNCDGTINCFDIDEFVLALMSPPRYAVANPYCDLAAADVNADGAVNNFDIDPFVACLVNGACP